MTPALRLSLLLAVFLIGGPGGPGFSHLTVLYTTAGYDSASAALLISYLGLVICVSKILCGQIYDRFGSGRATGTSIWSFWPDCSCAVWPTWVGCSPLSRP